MTRAAALYPREPRPATLAAMREALPPSDPSRGLTVETLAILADTCFSTNMAKAMPPRPAWVDTAFADSIAVVNQTLCGGTFTTGALLRLSRRLGAADFAIVRRAAEKRELPADSRDICFCCAATTEILLERSARGLEALALEHAPTVLRLFYTFAARGPLPSEYHDVFMRVVVPSYNAISLGSRRCIKCGEIFKPRSLDEGTCSRNCDANKRQDGKDRKSKRERAEEKFTRHTASCHTCKTKGTCPTGEKLFAMIPTGGGDALDRRTVEFRETASQK